MGRMWQTDHFERLGLPRRFSLEAEEIDRQYLARTRALHPDFHHLGSSSEQQASMELTARLNEAYSTLRDPFRRAEYLLQLEGGPPPQESGEMPPEFLEEILELRMALMDATEDEDRARLERNIKEREASILEEIGRDFAALEGGESRPEMLQSIRRRLNALKYIQNLLRRP